MDKGLDPHINRMLKPKIAQPLPPAEIAPEEEPKIKIFIWVVVIIAALVLTIYLVRTVYNPMPPVNKVMFNNFEFTQLPDHFWQFQWQSGGAIYNIPLRYNPLDVQNVTITGDLDPQFGMRKEVYVAVDPTNTTDQQYVALGVGELGLNLLKVFGVDLRPSCTRNETDACTQRPVVSCEDDTDKSIIVVREGPGPAVDMKDNCIIVRGEKLDLLRAVDRLLYTFYKIMP